IYLSLPPALSREWLIALFPPLHRDLVRDVLGDLGGTLRSYIVGQLLVMAFLAVLTAIFLKILQVPYWLTFGIFTGLVAIVPFFGTLVSTTLPALFVLNGPNGGTRALLVIAVGVVVHLIEGNIVAPYAMSKKVDLPPVLTIMAVLIMGQLLGGAGLIVAVPTLAMLMVIVRRILITRIYEGQGFRRTTRERPLVLRLPAPGGGVLVPPGPPGGQLPPSWRSLILEAMDRKLDIWSGLHTILGDDEEFARRARTADVRIHDLRKPPADIEVARGRVREVDDRATVILTVGTDCN